jgi:4-amino-4-deoxy-L-arabinose transferase-like glycosyltransferase
LRAGAGVAGVLSLLLAPLLHVLAIGLLPDTLLMLLSAALMYQSMVLMQPDAQHVWRHWLVLGILLGLAGLSKYTAIFAALAVAACLIRAHGWQVLRNAKLWASVAVALVLVLPVAYWNWQNQWISFTYQAKHGAGGGWQAKHLAQFLIVQALAFGPLLWWGWSGVRSVSSGQLRWLIGFFAIPFLVFAVLSGGGSGLPHWTAPAWVALAPFAGVGLAHALRTHQRRWLIALMTAQAGLCVALPLTMASGGMPFMQGRVASAQSSDPPNLPICTGGTLRVRRHCA